MYVNNKGIFFQGNIKGLMEFLKGLEKEYLLVKDLLVKLN
ncbi:hypothetical protein SAMN02745227_00364 [Anaerobranca californiensis DSM 14826]|jgi:hypothetical protein|uniref:Uncharacterized protein n=1 Tax=Anaerobranca californiensis DSM 14826 TaxID=1120989 RepID=A0A1M6L4B0_9FIRM|nr:hypothetical protein SAMN02745227_00364 [Anaerobranca californiensis DSM 14826]